MPARIDRLYPPPQALRRRDDSFRWPTDPVLVLRTEASPVVTAVDRLRRELAAGGVTLRVTTSQTDVGRAVDLRLDRERFDRPQAYSIFISEDGIEMLAADEPGAVYAILTLQHMVAARPGSGALVADEIEGVEIEDRPDLAVRGVMLDISRDRVPTMDRLYEWVELLATWKINQVQLYMEHTFAYAGHERVWRDADPLTGEELRKLDRYCLDRCIELVPNQNSFGHLHRWLVHDPYRALAECPQGVAHPFNETPEPFSLCPTDPQSLDFLAQLYDQLLPNFTSDQFNVGLDETFDLGLGRSAKVCEQRGRKRVYLDFLLAVYRLVSERDRRMQFWADILLESPEFLDEIPASVIPLIWGYEADHPFAEQSAEVAATGLEFYVCPGTSSWNSLAGRTTNALQNLAQAARSARRHGASGYLVTDWGDFGHMQPPSVSLPGLAAAAGCAWNASSTREIESLRDLVAKVLDRTAFRDPGAGLGECLFSLGDAYLRTGTEIKNGSVLFFLLTLAAEPLAGSRFSELTVEGLEAAEGYLADALNSLRASSATTPAAADARAEIAWVAATLRWASRLGIERLRNGRAEPVSRLPGAVRADLHRDLEPLLGEYRRLWLRTSRPGGLQDSIRRLERLGDLLSPNTNR